MSYVPIIPYHAARGWSIGAVCGGCSSASSAALDLKSRQRGGHAAVVLRSSESPRAISSSSLANCSFVIRRLAEAPSAWRRPDRPSGEIVPSHDSFRADPFA